MNTKKIALAVALVLAVGLVVALVSRGGDGGPTTPPVSATEPSATGSGSRTTEGLPSPGSAGARPPIPPAAASGQPIELGTALRGAKSIEAARAALAAGNPKRALEEIESYEKIPDAPLKQEAVVLKIEALSKSGRRSDALALAMSTRDDPAYAPHQARIDALITDAGLVH
jgi:hypothetical protein